MGIHLLLPFVLINNDMAANQFILLWIEMSHKGVVASSNVKWDLIYIFSLMRTIWYLNK